MTRINCGIPPKELVDKHLLAEHREIKRIPNAICKGRAIVDNIPTNFRLGSGHVKFFYDKGLYLKNRYEDIYKECKNRGFNITYYGDAWNNIPPNLMKDYTPTDEDKALIRDRIAERLSG